MIRLTCLSWFTAAVILLVQPAHGQGYAPADAASRMTAADGLRVKLFASEPEVCQPNFVKCDDRGRLWTVQYLQYPNPAGLERVSVDRWSRTAYDRVPEPPPHGPRGADRITILEDTDGDGSADTSKDFVDGLNLVTGVAFGHRGVYVLNVPYLLFYPDRDQDDRPDSDPEVLLSGFGMEDAQSSSNHLTWGPDGWLYGVNGSTTTCRIRGIEFQQGLWRFHPLTREFELFCEGGSNCYGVTFDEHGEVYYSTNGGPFVHAVQGGYFFKSFGKHGPLHNLYAYHFFGNLECDQVPGGPPTGGTIYLGHSFPEVYRGKFIAGNFLGHTASWWSIEPKGSTVRAKLGGTLIDSHDTWCGPTDMCLAPDGSMYLCDFYDQRTAHPDPDANWDRSNGRIYKIESLDNQPLAPFDVRQLNSAALVELLSHPNHWFRNRARCELAYRRDLSVLDRLRAMALQTEDEDLALQGLWAYHVTQDIDDDLASTLLIHPAAYVRYWTVRLLGDAKHVSPRIAERLRLLASSENNPVVRGQLAASAKRLEGKFGIDIINGLLERTPEEADERVGWLIWWAIESRALADSAGLITMLAEIDLEQNTAARENSLRLVRRCAAAGTTAGYQACFAAMKLIPKTHQQASHVALQVGLSERAVGLPEISQGGLFEQQAVADIPVKVEPPRRYDPLPAELAAYITQLWIEQPADLTALELALRIQNEDAHQRLLTRLAMVDSSDESQRSQILKLVTEFDRRDAIPILLKRFGETQSEESQIAWLTALGKWTSADITQTLLSQYADCAPRVRSQIVDIVLARPESARDLLDRVDRGAIAAAEIAVSQVRQVAIHRDAMLDELVNRHWGKVTPGTSEEKLATMRRLSNDLRAATGDPKMGAALFAKHCGTCHQLYGVGIKLGPDLTTANRQDRIALLANIVDPNAVVRREYINYVVQTTSGRIVTGLLAQQDAASLTLVDAQNQRIQFLRDEIEQLAPAQSSLMPEQILEGLTPQQLRDLFSYLEQ